MILPSTVQPDYEAVVPADSFTWTSPGAPVRISIRFDLISRLQNELRDASNLETGGVLLGRKGPAPATVEIRDCIRIPAEAQADGRYVPNFSELERLRQTDSGLERHSVDGSGFCYWYAGLSVVGYFRTQSKDGLRLRDAEIELVRKWFPDPGSVVLLIETSREQKEAGFFFWDPSTLIPFSFQSFPFDAAVLQRATGQSIRPPQPASQEVEEIPPEPEIAVNRWQRANLDIRTRWAPEAMIRKLAARSTPVFRALWKHSAGGFLAVGAALRRWAPPIRRNALAAAGVARRQLPFIGRSLLAAIRVMRRWVAAIARSLLPAIGVVRRRLPSTRSLLASAGAVLALTALCAILLTEYRKPGSQRSVPSQASLPFQLSVRAEGKGIDVRWDPQGTALADAHAGRLVITAPRKEPRIVKLDAARLASGHVFYRSSARGLNFRLDIIASTGKIESSTLAAVPSSGARQAPDPPQSVQTASAKAPNARLRAPLNGGKANQPRTAPDSVEPVVTSAVSALPSVDEISVGTERQDITEKFGAPAFSTETIVRGHALETMVYGPDRAHTQTIISLKDGKVSSLSSR